MAQLNFNEIKVFDDSMDDMDIIRNITNTEFREKAFYIADIGNMIEKHKEWIVKLPRVVPHFAIKCNPDPTVIKILAAMGACFDCASEQEIKLVMQYGVQGDRIIFAHPAKYPSHIAYAKKVSVQQMTVDSEFEIFKIKDIFPEAKIVIRIRCDAKNTPVVLGLKFGCESNDEIVHLIQLTKDLGLNLHGFSFHVGSSCGEPEAYGRGIEMCKQLITVAKSIGCNNVQLIDIGGGFPGKSGTNLDECASIINKAIRDLDPNVRVISEPGNYYVSSSFTLASNLHSKRVTLKDGKTTKMYFMNCGVFHAFAEELLGLQARVPLLLSEPVSDEKFCSSFWGPTASSYDLIVKDVLLPELHIGDWLVWKDMGGYSIALATTFNGYPVPIVIPFIRRSQWIPLSLRTRGEVTLDEARTQHLALAQLLRELDIDVVEMPPDENSPLCVFVEDVAVVCNGIALIARPNEPSRLKELDTIRAVLKKELEIPLIEISDKNARLDGGDVLFTGREFFVGLSHFTNEAGARAVAAAFPEYPCVPIKVGDGGEEVIVESLTSAPLQVAESKRLKALVTMAGPDVICVGAGKESQEVLKRIEREATYSYQTLTVPEDVAANVLYVNGTLIHRSENEIPQSSKVFAEKVEFPTRSLRMSELAKVSSGLSSCCLLVRRPRHIRSI